MTIGYTVLIVCGVPFLFNILRHSFNFGFPINAESEEPEGDYLKMPDGWAYFSGGVVGVGETKREAKRDLDEQRKNEKVGQDMDRLKKAVREKKETAGEEYAASVNEEMRQLSAQASDDMRRWIKDSDGTEYLTFVEDDTKEVREITNAIPENVANAFEKIERRHERGQQRDTAQIYNDTKRKIERAKKKIDDKLEYM